MKKGSYYKVTGGYFGAYWDGRKWFGFECDGCLFASGLLDPRNRLSGPPTKAATRAMRDSRTWRHRHDAEVHNGWLKAGKPKRW